MSDTPRTDAQCVDSNLDPLSAADLALRFDSRHGGWKAFVPAEFARELERELNKANEKIGEARVIFERLAALRGFLP